MLKANERVRLPCLSTIQQYCPQHMTGSQNKELSCTGSTKYFLEPEFVNLLWKNFKMFLERKLFMNRILESHKQNGGTPMMCYVSNRSCLLNCSESMKYPKARMKSDGKNSDKAELK